MVSTLPSTTKPVAATAPPRNERRLNDELPNGDRDEEGSGEAFCDMV